MKDRWRRLELYEKLMHVRRHGNFAPCGAILFSMIFVFTQTANARAAYDPVKNMQNQISAVIKSNRNNADIAVHVSSADSRVLFSHNSKKLFVPASITKLFPVAAALERLGSDFKVRTSVYVSGYPDQSGVLRGDLILYGRGDPNLSARFNAGNYLKPLEDLADQLAAKGVKRIDGNVVGDESYFDSPAIGAGWDPQDLQWYYGAEVSALSLDDNAVDLKVFPGAKKGALARIVMGPENTYMRISNQLVTGPKGSVASIKVSKPQNSNEIIVTGNIPINSRMRTYEISVHNPALFAATQFKTVLEKRGIGVSGQSVSVDSAARKSSGVDVQNLTELAFLESIPLSEEIKIINKNSSNLHAEIILRHLGIERRKKTSSLATVDQLGLESVNDFMASSGLDLNAVVFKDGSGLSRHNLMSAEAGVALLNYAASKNYAQIFTHSLAISGVDGTLRNRLRANGLKEKVNAKTGTMDNINAMAGYATNSKGKKLTFSIIVEQKKPFRSAVLVDKIASLIVKYRGE